MYSRIDNLLAAMTLRRPMWLAERALTLQTWLRSIFRPTLAAIDWDEDPCPSHCMNCLKTWDNCDC